MMPINQIHEARSTLLDKGSKQGLDDTYKMTEAPLLSSAKFQESLKSPMMIHIVRIGGVLIAMVIHVPISESHMMQRNTLPMTWSTM